MAWVTALKLPEWTDTIQFRLLAIFAAMLALSIFSVSMWTTNAARLAIDKFEREMNAAREERARQLLLEVLEQDTHLYHLEYTVHQVARLFDKRVAVLDGDGIVIADSHGFPSNDQFATDEFPDLSATNAVALDLGDAANCSVVFMEPGNLPHPGFKFPIHGDISSQMESDTDEVVMANNDGGRSGAEPVSSQSSGALSIAAQKMSVTSFPSAGLAGSALDSLDSDSAMEPTLSALQDELRRSLAMGGIAGGVAGMLLIIFLTRKAFHPMRDLTEAAENLGKGDLDQHVDTANRGEVGRLSAAFNTMASELQTAEIRRRRLTADIAHELRTPLANIRGYLEAVKDGVVKSEDQTIDTLHLQTLHLSALVDDLRLVAIADAGALNLDKQPDRIDTVVAGVVQAFQPRAIDANIQLRCEFDADLPLVDIDRTRMTQVVENLLNNAFDHSDEGGNIVVQVLRQDATQGIEMNVIDTGSGIPDEDIDQVFEQFYRVDSSRTRTTGGAGLGLTIVKRLVEAHGGEIRIESKINAGSTFTVSLPGSMTNAVSG